MATYTYIQCVYLKRIHDCSKALLGFIHFDKTIAMCQCADVPMSTYNFIFIYFIVSTNKIE